MEADTACYFADHCSTLAALLFRLSGDTVVRLMHSKLLPVWRHRKAGISMYVVGL